MGQAIGHGARTGLSRLAGRRDWWPFALLLIAYLALRVAAFEGVTTVAYRDSHSYVDVARQSLLSPAFWAGARPWTVPLIYKLLPHDDQARAVAQLVISVACWAALAVAVARCLRPAGFRVFAFAVVLAFSASFQILRWDRLVLSESVSISLTALVVAAWLELVRAPRPRMVIAVLGANLIWVFTRDSNAYLALATALPALVWLVRPGATPRRWPAILAAGLVAISLASVAATGTQEAQLRRNDRPLLHVVGRRVLIHPDQRAYFERHGMPTPTPLVLRHHKTLAALGMTIPSDPRSDAFLRWVRRHGRGTVGRYLIAHPVAALRPLVKFRQRLLGGVTVGYRSPDARMALPEPIASALYPQRGDGALIWLAVVSGLALVAALLGRAGRTWLVPIGVILLEIPHALLVYHGDTLEIPRHAILMAIMLRLGVLLLALFAVGALIEALAERLAARRATAQAAG
ncbi:MAG TPA: hypothetical protein VKA96_09280 [Solirubrobacteraceae bacterium]|nr:hypothetical protein [Solirubrobacteraceae bacterium]